MNHYLPLLLYIDAGSGSLLVQFLVAGIASVVIAFRHKIHLVKSWGTKRFSADKKNRPTSR